MEKIKAELTEITEKYKKDFETEINGDGVFETALDITALIDKYEPKLKNELSGTVSSQLKYIDVTDKLVLSEFIRSRRFEFREFALAFLLRG